MKFKVNDLVINIHTGKTCTITKVEVEWAIPVYEAEYTDGKVIRFNRRYEKDWELVVGESE